MALPFTVETLDSVPEAMRDAYVEDNGKYRLDLDGYEDPSGLKSALDKERKTAKEAQQQAKTWAALGKTPEEVQEMLAAASKVDQEKLEQTGQWDKLKAQILEQQAQERGELESKLTAKDAAIERYLVDAQATAAIASAKGSPELLLPHVKGHVRVIEDEGDFVVRVVDKSGNPRVNGKGEFLTIADLVGEMRQSDVFGRAFDASGTTGGGATNSGASGARVISQAALDALPPADRAKRMAEGYRVA